MLIAVVGLNGSGKDTVANYIATKFGYKHVSLSNIVRDIVREQGKDPSDRDNLNSIADEQRKLVGPNFLAKKALVNYSLKDKLVLSSFRHPAEIEVVKEKKGVVLRIDVPLEVRFARTALRKKQNPNTDHGSVEIEDFIEKEKRELSNPDKDKMQINEVLKLADFIIKNDSTLASLYKKIDNFMQILPVQE
ncbi:MAG: AAA family ATPase [archaeon]|jgi:dephospho-CoA kinase